MGKPRFSTPTLWEIFFDRYGNTEYVMYKETEYGYACYVDVSKSLLIFEESRLYEDLVGHPVVVIEHAKEAFRTWIQRYAMHKKVEDVEVRFYNLPIKMGVKELKAKDVSKFVEIEGIVSKVSNVFPKVVMVEFMCPSCGRTKVETVEGDEIPRVYCSVCSKRKMEQVNISTIDAQIITVQDYPEKLKGGEKPKTIAILLEKELVDQVVPGDRVKITGILTAEAKKKAKSAYLDFRMTANAIDVMEKEYEEFTFTEKDIMEIKKLSQDPDLVNKIVNSIAPSIQGYYYQKLAMALALFGGVTKTMPDGTKRRGDIHILLVGDPSTAKSQMLKAIANIAPRRIFTSGKGVSSAGLTASVTKDESGGWTLEAGALVLADKGVALIDELEKMSKEDRNSIHFALEQQEVNISKAGINATLMARCTVIASANPKYSRFDRYLPITEQIDLEPALLSRFDLIFLILDMPDETRDREVATHVLKSHTLPDSAKPEIDFDLLKKYIAYAKKNVTPKLPKELAEKIVEYYVGIRQKCSNTGPISMTIRQLEAIIRLSEAAARMRLRDTVTEDDVNLAIKLMDESLKQVATDPETGEVDIDIIHGMSKRVRDRIAVVKEIIDSLDCGEGVHEEDIIKAANERGLSTSDAKEILAKLKTMGEVYCPRYRYYKVVKF
jgi:replicative DNA helicase Mcm